VNKYRWVGDFYYRSGFKTRSNVRGQGAKRFKSGAYTLVREHFETFCNAAIGR